MNEEKTPAEQLYLDAMVQGAIGALEGISSPGASIPYKRRTIEMLRKALDLGLPLDEQICSHVIIGIDLYEIAKDTGELETAQIGEIGLERRPLALQGLSEIETGIKMDSQSGQRLLSRDSHFGIMVSTIDMLYSFQSTHLVAKHGYDSAISYLTEKTKILDYLGGGHLAFAYLQLGIYLRESGNVNGAIYWLERALNADTPQAYEDFYAGIKNQAQVNLRTAIISARRQVTAETPNKNGLENSSSASTLRASLIIAGIIAGVLLLIVVGIGIFKNYRNKADSINSIENAYVNTQQLNLRSGPGSEHSVVTKLSQGDSVLCLEKKQSSDGGTWVRVRSGTFEGWVNQKLLSNAPPQPAFQTGSDLVVSFDRVGKVQIGMTVQQASQEFGKRLVQVGENLEGCFYVKPEGGDAGISFMVIGERIARIDVTSNNISSDQGIRVGDTEEKVKSIYRGSLEIENHSYDEAGHYLKIKSGNFGMVFETDGKKVTSFRSGRFPEVEYVEGCA